MGSERRILVDADACPKHALAIALDLGRQYGWRCITYASYNHQIAHSDHVVVDASPQAVDLRLVNDMRAGDVVITQDIGLAALILGKQGRALSPQGHVYLPQTMSFMLEERNEKARFRRSGGRTRGPSARTLADDQRFRESLETLLRPEGEKKT